MPRQSILAARDSGWLYPLLRNKVQQDGRDANIGKGSIQIPYSDDLPLDLIAEIADWCRKTGNHA